ncbi:MAG: hypothetical protein LBE36_04440 [Flavobacteriaceae bacterium]|jgi:hypothetical protein|nr:hypothetical protein [Flavobacteriaceae bacterium]
MIFLINKGINFGDGFSSYKFRVSTSIIQKISIFNDFTGFIVFNLSDQDTAEKLSLQIEELIKQIRKTDGGL